MLSSTPMILARSGKATKFFKESLILRYNTCVTQQRIGMARGNRVFSPRFQLQQQQQMRPISMNQYRLYTNSNTDSTITNANTSDSIYHKQQSTTTRVSQQFVQKVESIINETTTKQQQQQQQPFSSDVIKELKAVVQCLQNEQQQFSQALLHLHIAIVSCENGVQMSRLYHVSSQFIKHFIECNDQHFDFSEWIGDTSGSIRDYTQAVAIYSKCRIAVAEEEVDDAIEYDMGALLRFTGGRSDDKTAQHLQSLVLLLQGIMSREQSNSFAEDYFSQMINLVPDFSLGYIMRGELRVANNRVDRGLDDMNMAVKLDQENPLAFQRRGATLASLGRITARMDLDRAIELDSTDPTTYTIRGDMYASDPNSFELALEAYTTAITLNNRNAMLYYDRAHFLSNYDDRLADALNDVKKVLEIDNEHVQAHYLNAVIEEKQQRYYNALNSIEKVIQLDSDYPLIYEFRARLYHDRLNDMEKAEHNFRIAIEKNSMTFQTPLYLGKILSERDAETALQLFSQAIRLEPDDPIAYTLRAYLHISNSEDGEAALSDYSTAIALRQKKKIPVTPELLIYRASAYVKVGEFDMAIAELEAVQKMELSMHEKQLCCLHLGLAYAEANRNQESLQMFNQAVEVDPSNPAVFFSRGLTHRYNNDMEKSVEDFSKAIELKGNNYDPVYFFERGLSYLQLQETGKAIKDFDTAILLEDQFVEAYNQRANALIYEKRYKEALKDLDRVVDLDPEDSWALIQRGRLFQVMGEVKNALEDLDTAINMEPKDSSYYVIRARVYAESLQDVRKAYADVNKALELDPQYAEAYMYRAYCHKVFVKDYAKALADLNTAIRCDEQHSESYYERGMLLLESEKYEEALQDFDKSIEIAPDSKSYIARARVLCLHKKNVDAAFEDCDRSLDYNPDNTDALNLKAKILLFCRNEPQQALDLLNKSISIDGEQVLAYAVRAHIYNEILPNSELYAADMKILKDYTSDDIDQVFASLKEFEQVQSKTQQKLSQLPEE